MTNGCTPQALLVLIWVGGIRAHDKIQKLTDTEQPPKLRMPMDSLRSKLA